MTNTSDSAQQGNGRDNILAELMGLTCDFGDADGFGTFVNERAGLLQKLDNIKEPWTQTQKAALQNALLYGAQILAEAQKHRQNMAKKIDHMRGAKRAHKGYSSSLPARFKKLL